MPPSRPMGRVVSVMAATLPSESPDPPASPAHRKGSPMTDEPFQPNVDELLAHNAQYVEAFADGDLSLQPARHLAIVACMDSRMDIFQMLGLAQGDAHVIRNAGGVVTDDVIRSLVLSQRLLGTREIILIHHTNCGLTDTRQSINRLRHSPFVQYKDHIRGFVYDVADGRLHEA